MDDTTVDAFPAEILGTKPETAGAGEVEEAHEYAEGESVKFFPHHFLSEVTAMLLMLSLISILCIFHPAPLDIKADPMATPEGSKPEWYFLFLYAYLHYVPPIVGVITPAVAVGLLFFLPWLDRNPETAPRKRMFAITASIVLLIIIAYLTYLGEIVE